MTAALLVGLLVLNVWALWYFRDGWQERSGEDWGDRG